MNLTKKIALLLLPLIPLSTIFADNPKKIVNKRYSQNMIGLDIEDISKFNLKNRRKSKGLFYFQANNIENLNLKAKKGSLVYIHEGASQEQVAYFEKKQNELYMKNMNEIQNLYGKLDSVSVNFADILWKNGLRLDFKLNKTFDGIDQKFSNNLEEITNNQEGITSNHELISQNTHLIDILMAKDTENRFYNQKLGVSEELNSKMEVLTEENSKPLALIPATTNSSKSTYLDSLVQENYLDSTSQDTTFKDTTLRKRTSGLLFRVGINESIPLNLNKKFKSSPLNLGASLSFPITKKILAGVYAQLNPFGNRESETTIAKASNITDLGYGLTKTVNTTTTIDKLLKNYFQVGLTGEYQINDKVGVGASIAVAPYFGTKIVTGVKEITYNGSSPEILTNKTTEKIKDFYFPFRVHSNFKIDKNLYGKISAGLENNNLSAELGFEQRFQLGDGGKQK